MNKNHNDRPQTIQAVSSRYAGKGRTELEVIKSVLEKNRITALDVTPVSVSFIPWKMEDGASSENMKGFLTWNSINCMLVIEYHLDASGFTGTDQYSLVLKWYLSKWNEEQKRSKGYRTGFLYSAKNGQEIILRTEGRVSPAFLDRKVKHFILRLHDIMNSQYPVIKDIAAGKCPEKLKVTLLKEIRCMLEELGMPEQEGSGCYGKKIDI